MTKTLCFDFGNTRLKAALFQQEQQIEAFVLEGDVVSETERLLHTTGADASILSSVIHHPPAVEELLRSRTRFHLLSHTSKLPFTIPVGKPETVGADRLAIAAAATFLFPRQNTLAIGLGSCITYNFINAGAELIGGAISPGMDMRFRSMHEYTAKLPLVAGEWNVPLIGYDTKTNLQTGVVMGMAYEIDGFITSYAKRFGNFNALLTGGNMGIFEPHLKNKIFADPDLIFKGLYAISQIN